MPRERRGEQEIQATTAIATIPNRIGADFWCMAVFPEYFARDFASGYPDLATVAIAYIPDQNLAELKSLKHFLLSFSYRYTSHERAFNKIFEQFLNDVKPKRLVIVMRFNPRGNMTNAYLRTLPEEIGEQTAKATVRLMEMIIAAQGDRRDLVYIDPPLNEESPGS